MLIVYGSDCDSMIDVTSNSCVQQCVVSWVLMDFVSRYNILTTYDTRF